MTKSFGFALPGSIYEVSPDYGMMAQAWNLYSFGVPIVTQFFGIQPDAGKKVIHISPAFPTDWKEAKIENVEIGDNTISLEYKMNDLGEVEALVSQEKEDWNIVFSWPASKQANATVNGNKVEIDNQKDKNRITFTGKSNLVKLN
jgi:hypothetical protein